MSRAFRAVATMDYKSIFEEMDRSCNAESLRTITETAMQIAPELAKGR